MKNPFLVRYLAEKLTLKRASSDNAKLNQSLARASIDLNPHQIEASIFAFRSPLSRGAILADEVGLGKTIEAGLIINQLWTEGKRHILVLCPASIRKQWQEELLKHFDLDSKLMDGQIFRNSVSGGRKNPLSDIGIFIASINFGYQKAVEIKSCDWDLIVVDEAHRLRNVWKEDNKVASKIKEAISTPRVKGKVLLTATPLQNNLMELFGLVSFIDDRALGTTYSYKKKFISPDEEELIYNLEDLRERLIGKINPKTGNTTGGVITRTLRRQIKEYIPYTDRIGITEDFELNSDEWQLYNFVSDYLARDDILAVETKQRSLMILIYRKILASSSFAIAATLKSLISQLERKLSLVKTGKIKDQGKAQINEEIMAETDGAFTEESEETTDEEEQTSKEQITEEALVKEIAELNRYYQLARSIQKNAKGEALVKALQKIFEKAKEKSWPQKIVIFTESRRTQNYLFDLLSENGYQSQIILFNGSNDHQSANEAYQKWCQKYPHLAKKGNRSLNIRQALIKDFEENKKIFITTEAGAEGVNLQFCNIVVNYDLPWNPQRIEQRIGRCHRYGQRYDVVVINFVNRKNAADERVYDLLNKKLKLFGGLFGASDEVLGALGSGIDFEKRILEIYQTCREPEKIKSAFDNLQKDLEDKINKRLLQVRHLVTENYDDDVKNKLKIRNSEINSQLSEFDRELKQLVSLYLENNLKQTQDENIFVLKSLPQNLVLKLPGNFIGSSYKFGPVLEKEKEAGTERLHLYHPLVSEIINDFKSQPLDQPLPVKFCYTRGGHKISLLNQYLPTVGFLFLYKLTFDGIEKIEELIPVVVLRYSDDWQLLTQEQSEKLLSILTEQGASVQFPEEKVIEKIEQGFNQTKQELGNKLKIINEEYYDQERERLDLYTEEKLMELDDKVAKKKKEWTLTKRKLIRAVSHSERIKIREEIYKLEKEYRRLLSKRDQKNLKSFEEKDKELKKLENSLKYQLEHQLILKAYFTLE